MRLRPAQVRPPARPPERAPHDAVVILLAQAARVPPRPPLIHHLVVQIVLLGLREQNLRLLRQARHVDKALGRVARAPAYKALARVSMDGLGADVARLALRVLRARLRRGIQWFYLILFDAFIYLFITSTFHYVFCNTF